MIGFRCNKSENFEVTQTVAAAVVGQFSNANGMIPYLRPVSWSSPVFSAVMQKKSLNHRLLIWYGIVWYSSKK
jgi:hypothetical protein